MNQLDHKELSLYPTSIEISAALDQIRQTIDAHNRIRFSKLVHDVFVTDLYLFNIIFSNLLENALKYSKPDSAVEVSVHRGGEFGKNSLVVSVSNEIGQQGYPDPGKVFVRFYRHLLASETTGSGVGLFLVQELAMILKGYVRYGYSAETMRVCFVVELPELTERLEPRSSDA
jgi:signal transduction histidine kinase